MGVRRIRWLGFVTAIAIIAAPLLSVCQMFCGSAVAPHAVADVVRPAGDEHHETDPLQAASVHVGHHASGPADRDHFDRSPKPVSAPSLTAASGTHLNCCVDAAFQSVASLPASRIDVLPSRLAVVETMTAGGDGDPRASSASLPTHAASPPLTPRATRVLRI